MVTTLRAADVSGSVTIADSHRGARTDRSGVVVWLEPIGAPADPIPTRARMIQKNKTFLPHVLAIPVGSTVEFPNLDPIFHNAFSNFNGQIFDVGLYPPGKSRLVQFRASGVVRVFCNIHPSMSAVIVVLDTPFFAVTTAAGAYRIGNVPPGRFRLHVFDERATPETLDSLVHEIEVRLGLPSREDLHVSEAGYIPSAHANKYGKAYPPDAETEPYSSLQ